MRPTARHIEDSAEVRLALFDFAFDHAPKCRYHIAGKNAPFAVMAARDRPRASSGERLSFCSYGR
jgi:hypothetical protein